jgi:3-hydroxyisobutyrate dehydrogenase-like beta-hydroxyacid dehydrogenase
LDFKIGFIGLGNMGEPMAMNLLNSGFSLAVHDINKDSVTKIAAKGGRVCADPKEVASISDVIMTSLPSPDTLVQVILGKKGVLEGIRNGSLIITTDTILPETIHKISEEAKKKGIDVLDAPISGGPHGAKAATLTIMVGGDKQAFERCTPIFRAIAKNAIYVGPLGAGCIAKLVNNLCSLANTVAACEGFVLGVKAGIDPKVLHQVVSTGTGRSYAVEHKIPNQIAKGNFEPGFSVKIAAKDLSLITALGRSQGVPLFLTSAVEQLYQLARAKGLSEKDHVAIVTVLEDVAGVKVRF